MICRNKDQHGPVRGWALGQRRQWQPEAARFQLMMAKSWQTEDEPDWRNVCSLIQL